MTIKRIVLMTFGIAGLGLAILTLALWFLGRDGLPPDDADLIVRREHVADADNAYTYLCALTNQMVWPEDDGFLSDFLTARTNDPAAVREMLDRNRDALAMLDQALACRICLPPTVDSFATTMPHLSEWRRLSKLLSAQVMLARQTGDTEAAVVACVRLLRFGDLVQRDAGSLIHYLVGQAILGIGLDHTMTSARDMHLTEPQLIRLAEALQGLAPTEQGLTLALRAEYRLATSFVEDIDSGRIGVGEYFLGEDSRLMRFRRLPRYLFQPNQTKQEFAGYYRQFLAEMPLVYGDRPHERVYLRPPIKGQPWSLALAPNAIGRALVALMLPAVGKTLDQKCRQECKLSGVRLCVAYRRYTFSNGHAPTSLAELVPGYLGAVPRDPYDGQPFRYLPEKPACYAVGPDLEDHGGSAEPASGAGRTGDPRWATRDIIFEL